MEVEFNRTAVPCLHQVLRQVQNQEVTQEIRLPESTQDLGKIVCCRGQVLIRSKEWRGRDVSMSGGVLAFVLYTPEDGEEIRSVDAWLPFQMRWDIPDSARDGMLRLYGRVCSIDARQTSAGKLLLRANVGMLAEALEPGQEQLYSAPELPEDVQLLKRSYPVRLPVEAGEKSFSMEESLSVDSGEPDIDRILGYEMIPTILDHKVMSEKVVFRGSADVQMLYSAQDGTLHSCSFEIPFSQYSDLGQEYGQNADADVLIMPTSLEMEQTGPDSVQMKAELIGQYMVCDMPMLETVEDAYSLRRNVDVQMQTLELPSILDSGNEDCRVQIEGEVSGGEVIASAMYADFPRIYRQADSVQAEMNGTFHTLYRNPDGTVSSAAERWEMTRSIPSDMQNDTQVRLIPRARPDAAILGQKLKLQGEMELEYQTMAGSGLPMTVSLQLGEESRPDPARPSLILRRAEDQDLWKLAKECGSTVDAIRSANHLTKDPEMGQLLLIPVP